MNAHDIESLIADALNLAAADGQDIYFDVPDGIEQLNAIQTFAQAGVLTNNPGLMLHLDDGSEFEITIVQSK